MSYVKGCTLCEYNLFREIIKSFTHWLIIPANIKALNCHSPYV